MSVTIESETANSVVAQPGTDIFSPITIQKTKQLIVL